MLGVPFCLWRGHLHKAFMGCIVCHAWISSHQRMGLMCIWHGIYLYLVSDSCVCMFVAPVIVFHHGLCHHCHNLQLEYHLLHQTHLVNLWIFHQIFIETYHLWCCSKWQSLVSIPAKLACKCCEVWWPPSSLQLWYPELTSLRRRYFTLFNSGKISLSVGPLWTGF